MNATDDEIKPPASWAKILDRRRGGWFGSKPRAGKAETALKKTREAFEKNSLPWRAKYRREIPSGALIDLMDAATARMLSPETVPDPESVEVEAAVACMMRQLKARVVNAPIVDYWVASRGLVFAVEAALSAMGLFIEFGRGGTNFSVWYLWREKPQHASQHGPGLSVMRTLRNHLADAPEDRYLAARDRANALRGSIGVATQVAASYLFPGEPSWCAEAQALIKAERGPRIEDSWWIHASETRSPFAADNGLAESWVILPAMVEGFGRELPSTIEREVRYQTSMQIPGRGPKLALMSEALAAIGTREAAEVAARHFPTRANG